MDSRNTLTGTQSIFARGDAPLSASAGSEMTVEQVLALVYQALIDKGYNPVNQLVGYIMSGDPTYITGHNGARVAISKIDRDELLEEIISKYIKTIK